MTTYCPSLDKIYSRLETFFFFPLNTLVIRLGIQMHHVCCVLPDNQAVAGQKS